MVRLRFVIADETLSHNGLRGNVNVSAGAEIETRFTLALQHFDRDRERLLSFGPAALQCGLSSIERTNDRERESAPRDEASRPAC